MAGPNINQRLNGLEPLAYAGVNSVQPPDFYTKPRDPGPTDSKNFYLGSIWLNTANENVWMLVSLVGSVATWVMITGASGAVVTLTGDSGGPVSPLLGNINILGSGVISVVGNPGTHTLTVTPSGAIASSFITSPATGTAVPVAGVLTFAGAGATTVSAAGSTVTITSTDTGATSFPTDSGTATPTAGVLNIKAANATLNAGSSVLFTGSTNNVQLNVTDASSNTIIGNNAGNLTLTASNSVGLGKSVLHALTSGSSNTVVGSLSGAAITSGATNCIFGESSGTAMTTGSTNTIIGAGLANTFTTGSGNVILGTSGAGSLLATSDSNNLLICHQGKAGLSNMIIIGAPINNTDTYMHFYPAASGNTFLGPNAGNLTSSSGTSTGVGQSSLVSLTTGTDNTAIGFNSAQDITSGVQNTAVGSGALGLLTTANGNTALGYHAGETYTTEANNICIGLNITGVAGDSAVCRIGNIRGTTTRVNDAIAVLIDSAGQLGTVSSSRTKKDNIVDMGSYSDSLRSLRPVVFNYKDHSPEAKSVGLIAEEVAEIAPHLVVYKDGEPETVKYHDLVPMLLNEFQKHCRLIGELQAMNCALLDRIRLLEEKNIR